MLSIHPLHPWTTVEHNDLFSLQPIRPNLEPYIKKTLFSFLNWSIFMIFLFSPQPPWSNEEPPLDQFFLVLFWAALKLQPAQIQIARFATKQQYNPPLICGLGRLQIWAGLMPDESTEFWSDVLNSSSLCSCCYIYHKFLSEGLLGSIKGDSYCLLYQQYCYLD